MLYGSKRGLFNEGHRMLILMAVYLVVIISGVDLIGEYKKLEM